MTTRKHGTYTREDLLDLLRGSWITAKFRKDIKAALRDGSTRAIASLGEPFLAARPRRQSGRS